MQSCGTPGMSKFHPVSSPATHKAKTPVTPERRSLSDASYNLPSTSSTPLHPDENRLRCRVCRFSTGSRTALVNHAVMKHGVYPDGISPQRSKTIHDPSRFHPFMSLFTQGIRRPSVPSTPFVAPLEPSTSCTSTSQHRSSRSHRLKHVRDGDLQRDRKRPRRPMTPDSDHTPSPSPQPSPARSRTSSSHICFESPCRSEPYEVESLDAARLYGPYFLEPYPMPDFAEDTVIFPLELPFDMKIDLI